MYMAHFDENFGEFWKRKVQNHSSCIVFVSILSAYWFSKSQISHALGFWLFLFLSLLLGASSSYVRWLNIIIDLGQFSQSSGLLFLVFFCIVILKHNVDEKHRSNWCQAWGIPQISRKRRNTWIAHQSVGNNFNNYLN